MKQLRSQAPDPPSRSRKNAATQARETVMTSRDPQSGIRKWYVLFWVVGGVGVVGGLIAAASGERAVGLALLVSGLVNLSILWWFHPTGQVALPKGPRSESIYSRSDQLQRAIFSLAFLAGAVVLIFKAIDYFDRGSWLVGVWALVGIAACLLVGLGGLATVLAVVRLRSGRGGRLARRLAPGWKDSDESTDA
jgi:hypothetical protein